MKFERVEKSHEIDEELLDHELELLDRAITVRRSHLRSIDELDHRDLGPRKRKSCPTPKKRKFKDKRQADRVLHLIKNDRKAAEAAGKHYRFNLTKSYLCACGYAHHTSQTKFGSFEVTDVA